MRLSIKTQMMILIVVMAIVPLGIIIWMLLHQRSDDLKAEILFAERLSNRISNEQKVLLSGAEQLLSSLAYIPCIMNRDAKCASTIFAELVKKTPDATNLLIADTTGRVWASALPMDGVIMAEDRRYFKNAMSTGNLSSGEYTIGRVMRAPALSFGYPIKDSSGKIRDVAIIAFTLTKFKQLLKSENMPARSSLVLTDHNGTILFDAGGDKYSGIKDGEAIFRRMQEGPDIGNFEATGITGLGRYFAYQKLRIDSEQTPYMYVRTGILKETVSTNIRNKLLLHAGMMMAITLLALGFVTYVSKRSIVDKIVALRDATRKVASGNMNINVSKDVYGGELDELGQALDEMARKLAEGAAAQKRSEEVQREKDAAEAANLVKHRLLRTIAHEFRTPLGLLAGSSDILDRYWDRLTTEKRTEQNEHIRSATQQLTNLINSVISFNQMETDREGNVPLLHDIGELCRSIAAEVKTVWGAGQEFEVTIAADCGTALLDEFPFRRVVENLLTNAFRYTPSDGAVTLHVSREKNRLCLEISDTGIGIPEEEHALIFDAFHRGRNVEGQRGLGLGLSIVSEALSQMGGTITVTSRTGEGTIMRVEIPVG